MPTQLHRDDRRLGRLASVVAYRTGSSSRGATFLRWERSRANRRSALSRRRTRRARQERQGFKKASHRYGPGNTHFAGRCCRTALQPWLCAARKLSSSQRRAERAGRRARTPRRAESGHRQDLGADVVGVRAGLRPWGAILRVFRAQRCRSCQCPGRGEKKAATRFACGFPRRHAAGAFSFAWIIPSAPQPSRQSCPRRRPLPSPGACRSRHRPSRSATA